MFYSDRKLGDNIKKYKYSDNTSTHYSLKGNRSIEYTYIVYIYTY